MSPVPIQLILLLPSSSCSNLAHLAPARIRSCSCLALLLLPSTVPRFPFLPSFSHSLLLSPVFNFLPSHIPCSFLLFLTSFLCSQLLSPVPTFFLLFLASFSCLSLPYHVPNFLLLFIASFSCSCSHVLLLIVSFFLLFLPPFSCS